MNEIEQTRMFARRLASLRDLRARIAIARRIERLAAGHVGDAKSLGRGVSELRVDVGPGYRVYFVRRGAVIVVLLCGGDKSSQQRDIQAAHQMAEELDR